MKNYTLYYLMIIVTVSLWSCSDILDLKPTSIITNSNFWSSEDDVEGAVTGLYVKLQDLAVLDLFIWGESRSEIMEWGQVSGTLDFDKFYLNTLNADNAGPDWRQIYEVINGANLILKYGNEIGFSSLDTKNTLFAEVYTVRAFMYYVLVRTWGKVPIRIDPVESYDVNVINKERSSVDDVFNLIKSDLNQALDLFPNANFNNGRNRWSKISALALKADVYLWTGRKLNGGESDIQAALESCQKIVNDDKVELLSTYSDIFRYGNKNNKEILMAVGFKALESGNNYFRNMYSAPAPTDVDPITMEIIGQYAGGVVWSMREEVQNLFYDTDTRKNATFIHIPADSYHPALLTKGRGTLISGIRYYTSDIILYRYADVILMMAEAKNALGQDPSQEINLIRKRAYGNDYENHIFINGSQALNNEIILEERLLELATEGKRWWDLVRFEKALDLVPSLQDKGKELLLFPISNNVLSLEPKIEQNPGY